MLRSKTALPDLALDALGNAERRHLVRLLSEGARSVGELATQLPISRPAVSRHLKLLEQAGLVSHEPRGNRNLYRLERAGLEETAGWLTAFWDEAEARLKLVARNTAPRKPSRG
jgi:DNA-binding transcriptional ArsR family regulator